MASSNPTRLTLGREDLFNEFVNVTPDQSNEPVRLVTPFNDVLPSSNSQVRSQSVGLQNSFITENSSTSNISSCSHSSQSVPVPDNRSIGPQNAVNPNSGQFFQVSESERRRYRQLLTLLLHAYSCRQRNARCSGTAEACVLPRCNGIGSFLDHIEICQDNCTCTISDCTISKALLVHWNVCPQNSCDFCFPIKNGETMRQEIIYAVNDTSNPLGVNVPAYRRVPDQPSGNNVPDQRRSTISDILIGSVPVPSNNYRHVPGPVNDETIRQQINITKADQVTSLFGPFSQATDFDKMKYKQQFILLMHAYICQKRSTENSLSQQCSLPQCRNMKRILDHMRECCLGANCNVPLCVSSKALLIHWKNCSSYECTLCFSLKQQASINSLEQSFSSMRL